MDMEIKKKFLVYYVGKKARKESTAKNYLSQVASFLTCTQLSLDDVTEQDIVEYFAQLKLKNTKKQNTRKLAQISLKKFYAWYSKEYGIKNPATDLTPIKNYKTHPKLIHPDELERMVYSIEKYPEWTDEQKRRGCAVLVFLAETGVRVEELENIKAGSIRVNKRSNSFEVIVPATKGTYERLIPFGDLAPGKLSEYFTRYYLWVVVNIKQRPNNPLFFQLNSKYRQDNHDKGKSLLRDGIQNIINRAAYEAGIDRKISPHQFRHFFATYYIIHSKSAYALFTLKELLGHVSIETTQQYVHIADVIAGNVLNNSPTKSLYSQQHIEGYNDMLRELYLRIN